MIESVDLSSADKFVVYSSVLRILHEELVSRNILSVVGEDQFVFYRRSTISPPKGESLDFRSKISPALDKNFMRANQMSGELDDYALKQPILPLADSSEHLEDFYNIAKHSDRRTRAVTALSNVGVDYQSSTAIVYVEVYSEIANLAKFYLVLKMSKVAPGYYANTFNGVDSFEIIVVE